MCGTMDDAGVECEGKVLLLFQKSLLLSSSDIIFDFKIGVIDMRNEWNNEIRFRVINHDCQTKHKIWHIFVSSVLM
jgi:hypothetical protein